MATFICILHILNFSYSEEIIQNKWTSVKETLPSTKAQISLRICVDWSVPLYHKVTKQAFNVRPSSARQRNAIQIALINGVSLAGQ